MDPKSDGCRLCLDPFAECYATIDNQQLKVQMEKVFCFSIEPKQGYSSRVCQSCSYAISEFYQYSEKVRQNQELLNGNVTNCDPTIDSKLTLASVKLETLKNFEIPETIEDACEPIEILREEEATNLDLNITLESVKVETLNDAEHTRTTEDECELKDGVSGEEEVQNSGEDVSYAPSLKKLIKDTSPTKQKRCLRKEKLDDLESDESTKNYKQTYIKRQQERNEEDQLFNKHFSMICDLCGTSAVTFTELVKHFRKEHKRRDGYVVCCNRKLIKRHLIREHIDFHADPDVFRCEMCGNKYKSKDGLNKHMLCYHSSAGPFKCDHCPQSFARKSALDQHMKRHVQVKCAKCNKILACKNSLRNHMISQHSGMNRSMACDTCGKEFLCKRNLHRHMNEHMGIEVQRFQCGICQRWLKGERSLRNHMKYVHTDIDPEFQCDICLQKYRSYESLYKHKRNTHTEPKHECEYCGKKFKTTISLKIEPKKGYCSGVCQSCSYAISEFYHYSEKVRQNQELLNRNVANFDPSIDSEVTLESVKVETLSDFGLPGSTEYTCEPKDEVSGEGEAPTLDSEITLENFKFGALSDSELLQTAEDGCEPKDKVSAEEEVPNSDDDESYEPKKREHGYIDTLKPTKNSKQTTYTTQQERNEEDQLFNKHFRMICDLCATSAETFTELRRHFRKEHKRRDGYVVCCNKKLFRRHLIRDHIDFHANPDVQVKCPKCNKQFACKTSLRNHMTRLHSGKNRTIVCDTCGKGFMDKRNLHRHMNEHMGIEEQRVQCEICQRWLKGERNLRSHMKYLHTDVNRNLQCDICLLKYTNSESLYKHKLYTHTEPKHECEYCGKKFVKIASLKEHRTTHTGEVLYTCEFCGISKSRRVTMYWHIKRQHPMERAQKQLMETQTNCPS